jgi:O-antigen/teichoic acid export membrane protein
VATNTIYNLLGQAAPLGVAFFAIPVLTRELGVARFGLLTLAWAVLGYFSLFDLGLGRALTQAVAERLVGPRAREVPALVWTGLLMMLGLGVVGAGVAAILSRWLVGDVLNVPAGLGPEARATFLLLALAIPVVIVASAVRGVLEAAQRFDLVNLVRVPLGAFSFAGPLLVLPFTRSLTAITLVLLLARAVALAASYACMLRAVPTLRGEREVRRDAVGPLLRFGSWLTVSNVISPLMVTLDRFVIGAVASMAMVAYYTAPWEAVTKLWLVPGALTGVLFPAFATSRASDPAVARTLYERGLKSTLVVLLPVVVVVVGFAHEGLTAWLGPAYAAQSTPVLRWLAVGVLINSVGYIPFALLQGSGRPDVTAKLHLAELPLYLAVLWWLVHAHGITGAAIAWTARAALDTGALLVYAQRVTPVAWHSVRSSAVLLGVSAATAAGLAVTSQPLGTKCAVAAAALVGCLTTAWFVTLSASERTRVRAAAGKATTGRWAAAPAPRADP